MPEAKILSHKEQHDIPFCIIRFANFADASNICFHKVIVQNSCGELSIKEQCNTFTFVLAVQKTVSL